MEKHLFASYKASIEKRIRDIRIEPDINTGMARNLLSKLDELYSELLLDYTEFKYNSEMVDQLLQNVLRTAINGKNVSQRTAAAVNTATNFDLDGTTVNLYELQLEANNQFTFINAMIKLAEAKQGKLITALGLMKIESSLIQ